MSKSEISPAFLAGLMAYVEKNIQPWHTPGHKQGRGAHRALITALGPALRHDISDVLEDPTVNNSWDVLLHQAEEKAASVFGSAWTRFLVNGTSGGIHAMILAYLRSGDEVVLPRASHLSVLNGLVLSGASPVYLPNRYDNHLELPVPPGPADYDQALSGCKRPKAILVTYPNYYGLCPDLRGIVEVAKSYGAIVLVDEAHGAHYFFHQLFPESALAAGADVVVQSTHKTLGACTQASMIHANRGVDTEPLRYALDAVGTTSPSSLLLASLDAARAQMEEAGNLLWQKALSLAQRMRKEISDQPGWYCLGGEDLQSATHSWDPSRLVFKHEEYPGLKVAEELRRSQGIQVEMADEKYVVALVGLGDSEVAADGLVESLKALRIGRGVRRPGTVRRPPVAPFRMSPQEAVRSPKRTVPWSESVGMVAGEMICPYPPGIPVVVPGEEITPGIVEYLQWAKEQGFSLRGNSAVGHVAVASKTAR